MNKSEIRVAIIDRLDAIDANCNSHHHNHSFGVIRGLLWALNGEDPGPHVGRMAVEDITTLAGIPNHMEGKMLVYATPGDADWPSEQ